MAQEIAEQFLQEIGMLRPERRTLAFLVDFVYHQIMSLNNEELRNQVLELLGPRIEQAFLQPPLGSPLVDPPQLPPSPAASTISIVSSRTIDSANEAPPPLSLEEPAIQYIPVVAIPCIPCFVDPHHTYYLKLEIPPPPTGSVNPSHVILRTQLSSMYPSTPIIMKSSSFDIHVEYQTIPTNGDVQ